MRLDAMIFGGSIVKGIDLTRCATIYPTAYRKRKAASKSLQDGCGRRLMIELLRIGGGAWRL
jgi:hypothetical protein